MVSIRPLLSIRCPLIDSCLVVICFILCWTPYYCIVFFLLITDDRVEQEHPPDLSRNLTLTTPADRSIHDHPSRDQRFLLIVMMLAVSNSVLDPLIYGNSERKDLLISSLKCFALFFVLGCYLVRPVKSNCFSRLRTRTATTTIKRVGGLTPGEKESKVSIARAAAAAAAAAKNGNPTQAANAVECQL